ncbi:hypothetical protein SELMODRAFT_420130 [Selaginella moellendorffii]|uniref:Isopenicillin N synthase-like Fe(2+) 2OG dioxygenase domain-containing protein n=1 Tax=Selaginella moellendorffii TaxID=88036 RepID=D8SB23_SELML|nr:hypothetical protein SELMODRAFT_420130 [Selaginella moellendorffii]
MVSVHKVTSGSTSALLASIMLPHLRHGFIPTRVPWSETFTLQIAPTSNVVPIVKKLWPDGNSELSSTIMDYGNELHCLGVKILELLAESLDLDQDFFSKNFKSKHSAGMRMNFYPPCPQPSMALGLGAHADPNCLKMLDQDDVGASRPKRTTNG